MNRLWMFYPENDVALAHGDAHFTAPRNAALLRHCGGFLMRWMCRPGDYAVYDCLDAQWEDATAKVFNLKGSRWDGTKSATEFLPTPWGWSAAARHELTLAGMRRECLPDDTTIENLRLLSHRRSSIEINRQLPGKGIAVPPLPQEVFTIEELEAAVNDGEAHIIKSPWSSSGRGIIDSTDLPAGELIRRSAGLLRRQGSLLVEKKLDKIRDFAALFEIDDEGARFVGLSLFSNVRHTAYTSNLVAEESILRSILSREIAISRVDKSIEAVRGVLTTMLKGRYRGYCGVDMMIYRDCDGQPAVAPCIEMNLRLTMGFIANSIAKSHIGEGLIGEMTMHVGERKDLDETAEIIDGRLMRGEAPLVAPNRFFNFSLRITEQQGLN